MVVRCFRPSIAGHGFCPGVFDPGDLRDELVERGERERGVGGEAGRGVGRERRQRGVADEEDVEVLRQVLVAGRRAAEAHVGRVAGQEDVADLVLLQEVAERRVAVVVVDDDVVGVGVDVLRDRDRQVPEAGAVVARRRRRGRGTAGSSR